MSTNQQRCDDQTEFQGEYAESSLKWTSKLKTLCKFGNKQYVYLTPKEFYGVFDTISAGFYREDFMMVSKPIAISDHTKDLMFDFIIKKVSFVYFQVHQQL